MDDLSDFILKIRGSGKSTESKLFDVKVEQAYATNTVTFSAQDPSRLPYRLENTSSFVVQFSQAVSSIRTKLHNPRKLKQLCQENLGQGNKLVSNMFFMTSHCSLHLG